MTSETKLNHTPAPWLVEIDHSSNAPEFIRTYVDGEMCDLASVLCDETGNATANARLIAAAPELLAALVELSDYVFDEYSASHPLCERAMEARELIKRVKGATG